MVTKPYLPKEWELDQEMAGFMSALKIRQVNPTNYDRIIEFWRRVIEDFCRYEKKCVIGYDELKFNFKRGNQLPAPLLTVLEELYNSQTIVPVGELASPRQGWLQWGASFLASKSSWLTGAKVDFKKIDFIHIPTLKAQAKELLNFYKAQYENVVDCPEVVEYLELKNRCGNIVCDLSCFDYVLDELIRQGEVSEQITESGERILKFKDQSSKGPAKFDAADVSVHKLKKAIAKIDAEVRRIEQRVSKFDEEARTALQRKDRNAALMALRKKKRAEKDMHDKDTQYQNLVKMLDQLATTKQTREVLDMYKTANNAYRNALERQGLTVDKVEETMDSIHDAIQDANDMDELLSQGFNNLPLPASHIDDAALEEELNALMAEEGLSTKKEREAALPDLPSVPTSRLVDTRDEDVMTRLKRLREGPTLS